MNFFSPDSLCLLFALIAHFLLAPVPQAVNWSRDQPVPEVLHLPQPLHPSLTSSSSSFRLLTHVARNFHWQEQNGGGREGMHKDRRKAWKGEKLTWCHRVRTVWRETVYSEPSLWAWLRVENRLKREKYLAWAKEGYLIISHLIMLIVCIPSCSQGI